MRSDPTRCAGRRRDGWCCQLARPSSYSLSEDEVWSEARRLVELGFSLDEVRAVLELPVMT